MLDIDFVVIFATENSNKFEKTKFWKEKLVEDMVTLGPMAQVALVDMNESCLEIICCFKVWVKVLV